MHKEADCRNGGQCEPGESAHRESRGLQASGLQLGFVCTPKLL